MDAVRPASPWPLFFFSASVWPFSRVFSSFCSRRGAFCFFSPSAAGECAGNELLGWPLLDVRRGGPAGPKAGTPCGIFAGQGNKLWSRPCLSQGCGPSVCLKSAGGGTGQGTRILKSLHDLT